MASSSVHEQPQAIDAPTAAPTHTTTSPRTGGLKEKAGLLKTKYTTRDGWLGDYDYAWCVCSLSCKFRMLSGRYCVGYAHQHFRS